MGTKILEAGANSPGLHTYAHCQRGKPGGVTVLALNLQDTAETIRVSGPADLYALTAPELQSRAVALNEETLEVGEDDTLPAITPKRVDGKYISLAPTSINFITLPEAGNPACRR